MLYAAQIPRPRSAWRKPCFWKLLTLGLTSARGRSDATETVRRPVRALRRSIVSDAALSPVEPISVPSSPERRADTSIGEAVGASTPIGALHPVASPVSVTHQLYPAEKFGFDKHHFDRQHYHRQYAVE